jgi:hypothetical protein
MEPEVSNEFPGGAYATESIDHTLPNTFTFMTLIKITDDSVKETTIPTSFHFFPMALRFELRASYFQV